MTHGRQQVNLGALIVTPRERLRVSPILGHPVQDAGLEQRTKLAHPLAAKHDRAIAQPGPTHTRPCRAHLNWGASLDEDLLESALAHIVVGDPPAVRGKNGPYAPSVPSMWRVVPRSRSRR